ncbi:hypothetical protein BU24DRAFT_431171 [Aaosphaeria arxii CBS 175.79]|uniref:gamma-glutamylcyclotransferase n=1 Tax=Aaosphaeria arxii CBS 175.79 TaxID=1450172 RepID=A0A6A5Y3C6_9PLEO|nr:uncharacterized protein BU24DRAFT_431171 [Aaosphaeria arxii CBS 175.79]KAF2019310.1 hypothetical protein BU24DRAFT_431171 [Aaosphaeria arxii CBS 175.79]
MSPAAKPSTIYFGYGSNLWLHQMDLRCPTSQYLGVARLNNYRWLINDRGYANVVEVTNSSRTNEPSPYEDVVYGLVYSLEKEDERRLDLNEGVPIAYTKELLPCDVWQSEDGKPVDVSKKPDSEEKMLVYIDRNRTTPSTPKTEYIYRMNRGISDALKQGVPQKYVDDVMRKFIPSDDKHDDDGDDEERKGNREAMAQFAKQQAVRFEDESGVFERTD